MTKTHLRSPLFLAVALAFAASFCLTGCENQANVFAEKERQAREQAEAAAARRREVVKHMAEQQKKMEEEALRGTTAAIEREYQRTQSSIRGSSNLDSPSDGAYRGDTTAARVILQQVKDAIDLDKTLVVWIIDTTPSALRVTSELQRVANDFYKGSELRAIQTAKPEQLLTAVVGFEQQANFILETPTSDSAEVCAAWDQLLSGTEGDEATFATLQQAIEKYLPAITQQQRRLMIVIGTDEAGSDQELAEKIVPTLRKFEIPVLVLGIDSPWGSKNPHAAEVPADKQAELPVYGPESVMSERVQIQLPVGSYRYGTAGELIDSGFGPFALEWVARAGGGAFLAARPSGGSITGGGTMWPNGNVQHFDPTVMKKYTPDYVSPAEYQQLLAANKARQALVDAAKLPKATVLMQPTTTFPRKTEADLKKKIAVAQRDAAKVAPQLEQLVDILSAGESDRSKLTELRWQAGFDLALGRALAARVRAEGYNAMLAALGRGRNFENDASNTWILEPADTIEAGSLYQKMADKAKLLLERVVQEHPNTPWAKEAEEDLKTAMGWQWREN